MYDCICVWGCLVCISLEYLVTILKITADSIVDCTVCVWSERARMYCVNGNKTVGVYSNCCVVYNSFRHTCAKARADGARKREKQPINATRANRVIAFIIDIGLRENANS